MDQIKTATKKPRTFVTCPHCGSKSKKLCSEFGGLETRKCQKGHVFEKDMWFKKFLA